ncbi:MAG: cysteine hydrolase [bacterium]|nr:MAG: cysteine hydrolase [bacterium]
MRKNIVVLLPVVLMLSITALYSAGEKPEKKEIKPVLLVMDVQNIWIPRMAEEDRNSAPDTINESIALFRKFGHPVIRVYHSDPQHGPNPGTPPFEFPESIAVTSDDPKIIKGHASAFTKTDLEAMLHKGDRNTVFLCGLSATGCVLATYFGAMDREFNVLMIKDALLSHNASYTDVIEDICYSVSIEELGEILENPFQ